MCPALEFAIVNWPACMMFTSFKILPGDPLNVNAQTARNLGHPALPRSLLLPYTNGP